jgi:hypothetical protein
MVEKVLRTGGKQKTMKILVWMPKRKSSLVTPTRKLERTINMASPPVTGRILRGYMDDSSSVSCPMTTSFGK